jgi:phage shock protein PspC (stress-responsive transcriptional regulator)
MDNAAPPSTDRPPSDDGRRGPDEGPRVTRDEVKDLGRLRRSITDRHIGGVAGGLARHLDVDPIIIRVAFVVSVFFGGAGLLAYAAAWILVPEEGSADRPLGLDDRNRTLALVGVGVLALLAAVGDWAGAFWFPWPVAIVALAVLWFATRGSGTEAAAPRYGEGTPVATTQPDAAAYDEGAYDGGWTPAPPPGTPVAYARSPRPRNPRKRGPILFWFTMALIALAEGVLGVVDVAGADVVPSAYPALALGITAVVLVVGSFWGRAGGLVLVGLVAAAATGISTAAHSWDEQRLSYAPDTSSEVRDSYELHQGELLLDLSQVGDVEELDGRDIQVDGGVGRIEVVVPDDVDVSVSADVGVGGVGVLGERSGGLGISHEGSSDGGVGAPDLHIGIDLGVGDIVVREN